MDNLKEEKVTYQTGINFKTTERMTKLTDGKVCCQGLLMHNHAQDTRETRRCRAHIYNGKMRPIRRRVAFE